MDAIARRAGVVKSALYWHFGSKEGLLIAALEHTSQQWLAAAERLVLDDLLPEARLDRLVDVARELFHERPDRVRLVLASLIECGSESVEVRLGVARILDSTRKAIADGMQAVLPEVSFQRLDGAAGLALEALLGVFVAHQADLDRGRLERRLRVVRKMVSLFLAEELKRAGAFSAP